MVYDFNIESKYNFLKSMKNFKFSVFEKKVCWSQSDIWPDWFESQTKQEQIVLLGCFQFSKTNPVPNNLADRFFPLNTLNQ